MKGEGWRMRGEGRGGGEECEGRGGEDCMVHICRDTGS